MLYPNQFLIPYFNPFFNVSPNQQEEKQNNKPKIPRMWTIKQIAETFKKEHKNVIRDIEGLDCSEQFRRLNFELSSYRNQQNKRQKKYLITKDGFTFLVMG